MSQIPGLEAWVLEVLRCPVTGARLEVAEGPDGEGGLRSTAPAGPVAYPVRDGIPVLLEQEARALTGGQTRSSAPARSLRPSEPEANGSRIPVRPPSQRRSVDHLEASWCEAIPGTGPGDPGTPTAPSREVRGRRRRQVPTS